MVRTHAKQEDLEFSEIENVEERITDAILKLPETRFEPKLTDAELEELPRLLEKGPEAFGPGERFWNEHSIAELMKNQFGIEPDLEFVKLTDLGRKLAGVDSWE